MSSSSSRTPLTAADTRYPCPRKSFLHPRNLATKSWNQQAEDVDNEEGELEEELEEELDEEQSPVPTSSRLVEQLLQQSSKSTKQISAAVTEPTEVEKGAPKFKEATTKTWIEFECVLGI